MSTKATHFFNSYALKTARAEAYQSGNTDVCGWLRDTGVEVLRVGLTLHVALPDGRVLRRDDIPPQVSVRILVDDMISKAE